MRAKALYDCEADHDDELEFREGDTLIIIGEADHEWLVSEFWNVNEMYYCIHVAYLFFIIANIWCHIICRNSMK